LGRPSVTSNSNCISVDFKSFFIPDIQSWNMHTYAFIWVGHFPVFQIILQFRNFEKEHVKMKYLWRALYQEASNRKYYFTTVALFINFTKLDHPIKLFKYFIRNFSKMFKIGLWLYFITFQGRVYTLFKSVIKWDNS
jgi:hypothetical protein